MDSEEKGKFVYLIDTFRDQPASRRYAQALERRNYGLPSVSFFRLRGGGSLDLITLDRELDSEGIQELKEMGYGLFKKL